MPALVTPEIDLRPSKSIAMFVAVVGAEHADAAEMSMYFKDSKTGDVYGAIRLTRVQYEQLVFEGNQVLGHHTQTVERDGGSDGDQG